MTLITVSVLYFYDYANLIGLLGFFTCIAGISTLASFSDKPNEAEG
jgi:hypothetical protein